MSKNRNISLTVFTPTYNRKHCLEKLYESLCNQSNKNFIWLVIDDGSTDNTDIIIKKWQEENKIIINYIKQENGGKYKAVNRAIKECKTELFAFIDSDDCFKLNTVKNFLDIWQQIKNNDRVAAVVGRRENKSGKIIGKEINLKDGIINEDKLYRKYKYIGDTCRMYRTGILKNNLYPETEEKFVPENVMLSPISKEYDIYFLNKALSVSEYLNDGYTTKYKQLIKNNKKGYQLSLNTELLLNKGVLLKSKTILSYILWSWNNNLKNSFKNCTNKTLYLLFIFPAFILYVFDIPRWYNSKEERVFTKIVNRIKIYINFLEGISGSKSQIFSAKQTVEYIIKNRKNIIRFGDGEFNFFKGYGVSYQKYDEKIKENFKSMLTEYNENSDFLICLPKYFFTCKPIKLLKKHTYFMCWSFARSYFIKNYDMLNNIYGDSFVFAKQNKEFYEKIFNNEKIVEFIIVHNNEKYAKAFEKTYKKKVSFIKIKSKDELDEMEETISNIKEAVKNKKTTIVLISAGPAGKLIIYKLSKENIWLIDVGHIFDSPLNAIDRSES